MSQDGIGSATNGKPRVFEYRFGAYSVRSDDLVLRYRGAQLALAPRVVSTLIALLDNAGRFLSKDELLHLVWGEAVVEEANLSQNIYSLRRLFAQTSGEAFIETLPKRGYRFTKSALKQPADATASGPMWTRRLFVGACAIAIACCVAVLAKFAAPQPGVDVRTAALTGPAEKEEALGWYYWRGTTEAALRASIRHFRRVAQLAPRQPEGYAGEAVVYAKLADLWDGSPSGLIASVSVEKLARQAVATRGASPIARAARGLVECDTDGDLEAAASDLRFAVSADPALSVAHTWYGAVLLYQGDLIAARRQLTEAASANSPASSTNYLLALDYYFSRDYQDAIAYAKLEIANGWFSQGARMLLAAPYEETRQYDLAIREARQLHANVDDRLVSQCALAQIYAAMGSRRRASSELAAVESLSATNTNHPLAVALAYAANQHPSEAFAWLSRLPQTSRQFAGLDPRLDPLRHDPRFAQWISD